MPVPLVKGEGGWRFDVVAGRKEIAARVIGFNELGAIDLLGDLVDAQRAYFAVDRDGDDVLEYAQSFKSSEGKRDGLWWDDEKEKDMSPLGLAGRRLPRRRREEPRSREGRLRLSLEGAEGPGRQGAGRRVLVRHQREPGRGLRVRRDAGRVRQDGRDDASSSARTARSTRRTSARRAPTSSRRWRSTSPTRPGRSTRKTSDPPLPHGAPCAAPTETSARRVRFGRVVAAAAYGLGSGLSLSQRSVLALGVCSRNVGASLVPLLAAGSTDRRSIAMCALAVPVTVTGALVGVRTFAESLDGTESARGLRLPPCRRGSSAPILLPPPRVRRQTAAT